MYNVVITDILEMMEVSPMRTFVFRKETRRRRWRMKIKITWNAVKKTVLNPMKPQNLQQRCASTIRRSLSKFGQQKNTIKNPTKPLGQLLIMPYSAADFIDRGDHMTPTKSPKENISKTWKQLHGLHNWEGLLDPLVPSLRREIIKYGEFVEATYDAFDFDPLSEFCGSSRYNRHKLFDELGLTEHGYKCTKYFYAMSHVDVPKWFERSELGKTWSKDSNWMGYVAVSGDKESERIGRRDIVIAWRGTVAPTEWFTDLKSKLLNLSTSKRSKQIKVQHGFLSIYRSKSEQTRYNRQSASEQVMEEMDRLINFFTQRGEEVSITITGHSLGGALALLNAYEAKRKYSDLFINVISFGAPRVGNLAFKEKLNELGVKTMRVVVKQDLVPKLPGLFFNKILNKLNVINQRLNWVYRHVGTQLKLDVHMSPYVKTGSDFCGSHNLELYLHLLDGYVNKSSKFRWNARRDIALVNKSSDMLKEELRIPEFWYQMPHKGLVLNRHGRWVKPAREAEDIPSPFAIEMPKTLLIESE